MLLAVKDYVQQHPGATVAELGWHFQATPETIDSILQLLQRKGYVRRSATSSCGDCQSGCQTCPLKASKSGLVEPDS